MPATSYQSASKRRRGTSIALTIVAHILILILLLTITPSIREKLEPPMSTFELAPESGTIPTQRVATRAKTRSGKAAAKAPAPPLPPPMPVKRPTPAPDLMHMTADEFAATDLANLPRSAGSGSGDTGADTGDSVAAYGPGEGPGGQRLYNAEWYREPTNAELSYFMPPAPPGSWAMIACRTVAAWHVDNCRALDESPAGSGLSKGLRRAAWQFLVRPPRIGGKPMLGAWVRIRIDFTQRGAEARR